MRARRGSILEVKITDGEGILTLTFFNQAWRAKELVPGVRGIFAGKVSDYRGALQLAHPDYELFDADDGAALAAGTAAAKNWAQTPIPIYPATGTVASWQVQKAVALVLDALGAARRPGAGSTSSPSAGCCRSGEALELHPPPREGCGLAARAATPCASRRRSCCRPRCCSSARRRARRRRRPARPTPGGFLERFDAALPFTLTDDQATVGGEIARDLADTAPMNRLVQGEVGSGKTLVALRAMLAVADSGGQSALLAPTEVLAAQHLRSIVTVLGPDLAAGSCRRC